MTTCMLSGLMKAERSMFVVCSTAQAGCMHSNAVHSDVSMCNLERDLCTTAPTLTNFLKYLLNMA